MNSHKQHYSSQENAHEAARDALVPHSVRVTSKYWDGFVATMRITLPILAFIVGSITISWPFLNETEVSFTLSQEDVARGEDKVRMQNLRYVGTDAVDRLFKVEAKSGMQENSNAPRIRLETIRAQMALAKDAKSDEMPAFIEANTGIYRIKEATLSLIGGVHMESGDGYIIDMAGAEIDMRKRVAVGQGSIVGVSPLGKLSAERLTLDINSSIGLFEGSVKIHIKPNRQLKHKQKHQARVNRKITNEFCEKLFIFSPVNYLWF